MEDRDLSVTWYNGIKMGVKKKKRKGKKGASVKEREIYLLRARIEQGRRRLSELSIQLQTVDLEGRVVREEEGGQQVAALEETQDMIKGLIGKLSTTQTYAISLQEGKMHNLHSSYMLTFSHAL